MHGFEEAFGHEAGFGEGGAADVVLGDAAVLGVGLAEEDGFVGLGDEEAVEDFAVFEFDAEGQLFPEGRGGTAVPVKYVRDEKSGRVVFSPK